MSEEVWHEVLNNTGDDKDDLLVSFTEYMELLSSKDPEFVYEILEDTNGQITGCLWMTSTMRENFDLFGGYVCVDAMKRGINTLLWPYIATTMYNELESVCVGCEGIVTGERVDAYRALLDFQVRNSTRKKEEIYGLSADGFLSQEVLNSMGFQATRFVMDYFHLFDSVLPKRFGHDGLQSLLPSFSNHCLVFATTFSSCCVHHCGIVFESFRFIGIHVSLIWTSFCNQIINVFEFIS